ncbi:SDR family NAD(P)-dependent oxidoreductase [Myxococcus virescens]|uniref:SDR family NAD(P)-dependent oxidoreductase n=1 Tax=Myxococcus virescens TaxID=83456 RepID=UPI003DA62EF1
MNASTRFQGAIVLVTGGTAGIGLACAEVFARGGAQVVVVGRDAEKGERVRENFATRSWACDFISADVSKREGIQALFAQVTERYGRLTVAVNNAGTDGASFTPLLQYPDDIWDEVINLNLTSVYLCMKAELALMMGHPNCAIINVASLAGLKASYSGGGAYTASKHGLIGLTKSAAIEYAPHRIRINAVCPGLVRTQMAIDVLGDEKLAAVGEKNPLGRLCEPREVADTVAWLSTPESSFVTGVALPVDGGLIAS